MTGLGEPLQQLVTLGCQPIESVVDIGQRALEANDIRSGRPGVGPIEGTLGNRGISLGVVVEVLMETQLLSDELALATQSLEVVVELEDAVLQAAHVADS